jgi:anti-sigma factor RsiW
MNSRPIIEADLHAYLDGLLSEERCQEVERYLVAHPDEAQRIRSYRQQKEKLRTLFNPVLEEAIPAELVKPPRRFPWYLQRLVAGIAIAMVGGIAGWVLHGQTDAALVAQASQAVPALAQRAAVAHVVYSPDMRHPVEVEADQEDHLVAWLSKRLGAKINPPKLNKLGYELIGGRLLPGEHGPVAQFMYHNTAGQRITLYVSTEQSGNKDTGFRFAEQGPVKVFYWIDGKFGYALSAGIDKQELTRVAILVYEQLENTARD